MQQSEIECDIKERKQRVVDVSKWSVEEFFRHFQDDVVAITNSFYEANKDYVSIEDLTSEAYIALAEYYNSGKLKNYKRPSDVRQKIQRMIDSRVGKYCAAEYQARSGVVENIKCVNTMYSDDYLMLGFINDAIQQAARIRLDERRRLAFNMYNDGYTYDEIGKVLHVTGDRVRVLVNESFRRLSASWNLWQCKDIL